jgi:hypothetical protein
MLTPILRFGVNNDKELSLLNVFFAARVRIWLFLCWVKLGLEPLIVDGLRTQAEQDVLYKQNDKNARLVGSHDGHAVDMNFKRNGVLVLVKASTDAAWQPVYELAEMCGILNGSKFKGYRDSNHFYVKK